DGGVRVRPVRWFGERQPTGGGDVDELAGRGHQRDRTAQRAEHRCFGADGRGRRPAGRRGAGRPVVPRAGLGGRGPVMLVAVLSLKGSPGVTTFSIALAARWPATARALLVEADPSGGDIATRFSLASAPGLVSFAAAARRSTDPGLIWQHAQALPGGLLVV